MSRFLMQTTLVSMVCLLTASFALADDGLFGTGLRLPEGVNLPSFERKKAERTEVTTTEEHSVRTSGVERRAGPGGDQEEPQEMPEERFAALLDSLSGQPDKKRLQVVANASTSNAFTCDQVLRLLELFRGNNDRMALVNTVSRRIVDRENGHLIVAAFKHSDHQRRVSQRLEQARIDAAKEKKYNAGVRGYFR